MDHETSGSNKEMYKKFAGYLLIIIVFAFMIFLGIKLSNTQRSTKDDDASVVDNTYRTVFQTNLSNVDNTTGDNFFIEVNKENNPKITVIKNGKEEEVYSQDIQNIFEAQDDPSELPEIRKVVIGSDEDIGFIHDKLEKQYYRNSSGYIIPEDTAMKNENICIATSNIYNNWACFIYQDQLIMSYSQNFAD